MADTSHSLGTIDESVRRRFEAAWLADRPEPIEDFLPPDDAPHYVATLTELVAVELELAWKRAQKGPGVAPPPLVEHYLARFPPLNHPGLLLRLLQEEWRARNRYGDKPQPEEYHARFPALVTGPELLDTLAERPSDLGRPPEVPGYEMLGVLGRGGMGVVYKARQVRLKRLVALKMISASRETDPEVVGRFQAEAEAVAHLQHPHIVHIYEVGEHAGRPFFSLELVDGGTLAQRIARQPQPPRQAGQLVETLARAVHYAHEHGIIHRDLKPANVLLTADGQPKVTDFGLAKHLQEETGHTQTGAVLGTPAYMAPEQARGKSKTISPAADIYALGAILYEMLTGRPPFCGDSALEVLERVCTEEPVPPRKLQPKVHRDLETICLKALAKEPERRYPTALALAEDLQRFDIGESIVARREGPLARLARQVRRHRTSAALFTLLVAVIVGVFFWARFAQSDARRLTALRQAFDSRLDALELTPAFLDEMEDRLSQWEALAPDQVTEPRKRLYAYWSKRIEQGIRQPKLGPDDVAQLDKALELLASREPDLEPVLRRELKERRGGWETVFHLTSPFDGLAQVFDSTQLRREGGALVAGPAAGAGQPLLAHQGAHDNAELEAVFPEGWDSAPELGLVLGGGSGHSQTVSAVAFAPRGHVLASAAGAPDRPGEVIFWDLASARELALYRPPTPGAVLIAFDPRGNRLAVVAGTDPIVRLLDPATGQPRETFRAGGAPITCLAFRPDGGVLATGSGVEGKSGEVTFWDTTTWQKRSQLPALKDVVAQLTFTADGKKLAIACKDNSVHLWDLEKSKEELAISPVGNPYALLAPDGKTLLVSGFARAKEPMISHLFGLYDVSSGALHGAHLGMHPGGLASAAFSPDGKTLAISTLWGAEEVRLVDVAGRASRPFLAGGYQPDGFAFTALAFSPDGTLLATGNSRHSVQLWDLGSGQLRAALEGQGYHFVLTGQLSGPREEKLAAKTLRDARVVGGMFRLQVLRHNTLLREESVQPSQVSSGPLRLTARRQSHRLAFQVNDRPPLEYQELLPASVAGTGAFGVRCPAGTQLERLRASQQNLAQRLSLLEQGDDLLARGRHGEALIAYQQQAASAGATEAGQEARLKAATCLQALQRLPEATELLEKVAAEDGPRWPLVAGCRLLLLRLAQHQYHDGAVLIESLANRYRPQEVENVVAPELQRRLLLDLVNELTEPLHYLVRVPVLHAPDMALADAMLSFFPSCRLTDGLARMAILRGHHLSGRLDRTTAVAQEMLQPLLIPPYELGALTSVFEQYCWALCEDGKADLALRKLDELLVDKGTLRVGHPRLLLLRCRLHLALGRTSDAEADLNVFFRPENVKLAALELYPDACLIRGFLLADRGDQAGARTAWRMGFVQAEVSPAPSPMPASSPQYLTSLSDPVFFSTLLAGALSGELSDTAAAEALEDVTTRSQARDAWAAIARLAPLPRTLLRDMVQSERGKTCARRLAFRTLTYGEHLRLPRAMMAAELLRQKLFPMGISREQDDALWAAMDGLIAAHMRGELTTTQLGNLALAWKGASGKLGWEAVEKALAKDLRAPCAYLLGLRYLQLDKLQEARQLFVTAHENSAPGSPLRRLVQAQQDRLRGP